MKGGFVVLIAVLASPLAALADARSEVRAGCQADVKSYCGMVMSRSKALACLIDNAGKLSGPCKSALSKASCGDKAPADLKAAFACKHELAQAIGRRLPRSSLLREETSGRSTIRFT
jgi:hypothetical protein